MTQDQLKSAVLALGFERSFDDDNALLPSLTRALYTVYTDRPVTRSVSMIFFDAGRREIASSFTHTPGTTETFELDGCAYAFRVSGKGSFSIGNGDTALTEDFDTDMAVIRGHIAPSSQISFFGNYAYSVHALSSFRHLLGPEIADIPEPGDIRKIDLSERYSDYLSPEGAPRTASGAVPSGCFIRSDVLHVPCDFTGELYLTYRRRPSVPTLGIGDEMIDVPPETEELLPLLVASYLWLDDAPDKAQYYMALYREGISGIKRFSARGGSAEYRTNGWA